MRKKYLSALLFGALLLASAGTFTSCKDYDDDIKNLQEQINTVKTSLDELTTKVNNLGAGIKDFKYENGQLVIVTDKDTNFTVDLPACEGIVKLEIKDGVLYADGVAVGNVSGDGGSVVEVKDGVLYIDGKAQELTIGDKVTVVDNGDGTYTMTVGDKSYVLPKAVAADVNVEVDENSYFTAFGVFDNSNGISWGTAAKDVDWNGPKGSVKAGQFLVGQIAEVDVVVTPYNTELDKMTLKLVDSEGNFAPVVVSATPLGSNDVDNTGTRSTDKKGKWILTIATDETVSENNMGSAFATTLASNGQAANKKYALMSDGRLLSDYNIVVDTDVEATEKAKFDYSSSFIRVDGSRLWTSQTNVSDLVLNANHVLEYKLPDVYDYKFSIAAADQNDAEKYGITLVDNVLKGTDKAAGKTIALSLSVIGVDGTVYTYTEKDGFKFEVSFGDTKADAEDLAPVSYQLNNACQPLVIDLGNTFSGLTAEEATYLNDAKWSVNDADGFMLNALAPKYFSDAACKNEVKFADDVDNIKNIKYAQFAVANNVNATPVAGKYTLTLTLSGENGEVKKVNAPVTVTLPAFADLFNKSAAWSDNVATLRFNAYGAANITTLYSPVDKDSYNDAWWGQSVFAPVDNKNIVATLNTTVQATADIVNADGTLKSTTAEVAYNVCGKYTAAVKSGEFTVKFLTVLDGSQIVNYDGSAKETAFTVNGSGATFSPAKETKNGFALILNGKKYYGLNEKVEGLELKDGNWTFAFDDKAGDHATVTFSNGSFTVSNLAAGNYKTQLTLIYTKSINNTISAHTPIVIELDVKNGTAQN